MEIFFFFFHQQNCKATFLPHLVAAKVEVEVLEISKALVGEARVAQRARDVGQRGEVVAQRVVALRLYAQLAAAVTGSEVLEVKVSRLSSFITWSTRSLEASAAGLR